MKHDKNLKEISRALVVFKFIGKAVLELSLEMVQ
jgi:hypothetical protein